jgi:hypothetical protein
MQYFSIVTFPPTSEDNSFVVIYYNCYSHDNPCETSSESLWIVPGTLEV